MRCRVLGGFGVGSTQRRQRGATGVDDPRVGGEVEAVFGEERQLRIGGFVALARFLLAGYSIGYPSACSSSSTRRVNWGTRWWRGLLGTGRPSSAVVATR